MEAVWIGAGIFAGLVVGYLAAAHGRPGGIGPEDSALATRVKALESDVERLRLDFQDTLDKIMHLYDRVRKRLALNEPAPNGAPPAPVYTDKHAEIRARARLGGLLK